MLPKIAERSKHREAIKASRSDVIEDRGAIGASRSDAHGASQMMTRRGLKCEAPPARHHRAIADAPRGIILLTSRVSIYLYSWGYDGTITDFFVLLLTLVPCVENLRDILTFFNFLSIPT